MENFWRKKKSCSYPVGWYCKWQISNKKTVHDWKKTSATKMKTKRKSCSRKSPALCPGDCLSVCLSVRQKLPGCEENKLHSNPKPRKTQISPCLIWSPDFFISCKCTRSSVPWEVLLKKSHTPNPPTHTILSSHTSIPEEKIQMI